MVQKLVGARAASYFEYSGAPMAVQARTVRVEKQSFLVVLINKRSDKSSFIKNMQIMNL